jgi:hypothetical protein
MLAWRLNRRNAEQTSKSAFTSYYRTALLLSTNPFAAKEPFRSIITVSNTIIEGKAPDRFT